MSWQLPVGSYQFAGVTVLTAVFCIAVAGAQAPSTQKPTSAPRPTGATTGKPAGIPRTSDGRPDLQGNWSNATITPLERLRPNTPLVITEEAALEEERKTAAAIEFREQPSDPNRGAPPVGGELRKSPNGQPS